MALEWLAAHEPAEQFRTVGHIRSVKTGATSPHRAQTFLRLVISGHMKAGPDPDTIVISDLGRKAVEEELGRALVSKE
jgi:hypothetical protein